VVVDGEGYKWTDTSRSASRSCFAGTQVSNLCSSIVASHNACSNSFPVTVLFWRNSIAHVENIRDRRSCKQMSRSQTRLLRQSREMTQNRSQVLRLTFTNRAREVFLVLSVCGRAEAFIRIEEEKRHCQEELNSDTGKTRDAR
jgi:hypothetical protein